MGYFIKEAFSEPETCVKRKPVRGPIRGVISGYRSYSPELGRWVSQDPIYEAGFEIVNGRHVVLKDYARVIALKELLIDMEIADSQAENYIMKTVTHIEKGNRILRGGKYGSYTYLDNNPGNYWEYLGLKWYWPPDWFDDEEPSIDCCGDEAFRELIKEAISTLLKEAKNFPGKAGEIAEMIVILEEILDTGEYCFQSIDDFDVCKEYSSNPDNPGLCYGCCMLLQPNKGTGHFVCTGICGAQ